MKIVIATHPSYQAPLSMLLRSLDYTTHLDEVVVVVSGVGTDDEAETKRKYIATYGLKHIITFPENQYEYTAFAAIGSSLEDAAQDDYYVMLHDTTIVGPGFWEDLKNILDDIKPPVLNKMNDGSFMFSKPLIAARGTTVSNFYLHPQLNILASLDYHTVYVGHNYTCVLEASDAIKFPDFPAAAASAAANANIWYPFADNFNMGIATRAFTELVAAAFKSSGSLDKKDAVMIEMDIDHPLNLKKLASHRWMYATPKIGRFMSKGPWVDDTDVYGDGKLRCVCGIVYPNLIKFVCTGIKPP